MSYCRTSSDDFQSDVYVVHSMCKPYSSFEILIPYTKTVFKEPIPPPVTTKPFSKWTNADFEADELRDKKIGEMLRKAEHPPLGLPLAGKTLFCRTRSSLLKRLLNLRKNGYRVPEFALVRLRREIREIKHRKGARS